MNLDNSLYWMIYRGWRRYVGEWRMARWKIAQARWHQQNQKHRDPVTGKYRCALCGYLIWTPKSFTLDHIIPIHIIFSEQMDPELLFEDNLQAAHHRCNSKKGGVWHKPGDILPDFQSLIDKKNHV